MRKYIENKKWISCGVNLDEDLHFSTSYLRMSLTKNIGRVFPGYSSFIAVYENFNEEYYLDESECISVSKELIEKIKREPSWFDRILNNIIDKSELLNNVFDEEKINKDYLKKHSLETLKTLYQAQLDASLALYEYARVPEVLDRGVNYFTNYLFDYLKKQLKKDDVSDEFFILTSTEERSIFQIADDDLIDIIKSIPCDILENATLRNLRLRLPNKVKDKINAYLNKWKYLEYHGYGSKKILNDEDILNRILDYKNLDFLSSNEVCSEQRASLIKQAKIPTDMQTLFRIYPRIAITKLHRKYYQIRNFSRVLKFKTRRPLTGGRNRAIRR